MSYAASRFSQVKGLLIPITVNMMLTLTVWIGTYGMETKTFDHVDFGSEFFGKDVADTLMNYAVPLFMMCLVVVIYIVVIFDFRTIAQVWVSFSTLFLLFGLSSEFFYDALIGAEVTEPTTSQLILARIVTAIYGAIGATSFFTGYLPSWVHRAYVICNCSLVSLFYLRIIPGNTLWAVVIGVAAWSTFAVLSPIGLYNVMKDRSGDYNGNMLRFLMYTAYEEKPSLASSFSNSSDSDSEEEEEEATALDVLNDGNTKIGMGDIIFFSVIVGKAATSGSVLATIAAFIGVHSGITYAFVFQHEDTIPVLSFAVYFGIIFHIMGVQAEPLINYGLHLLYDSFALGF